MTRLIRRLLIIMLSGVFCLSIPDYGILGRFPGQQNDDSINFSGHLLVESSCEAYLYYVGAVRKNFTHEDPVVLWLQGGPGSSSMIGFFSENGPVNVFDTGLPSYNSFSWHNAGAFIAIDQPVSVGFSRSKDSSCFPKDEDHAMEQLAFAIDVMLREHVPGLLGEAWKERELYIMGESYGGKYVPELALKLLQKYPHVNLKAIGIGNGWVDPRQQQGTYSGFAYEHGLISEAHLSTIQQLENTCWDLLNDPQSRAEWEKAQDECAKIEDYILEVSLVNQYDIRKMGDYNMDSLKKYLDDPAVRAALRVSPDTGPWEESSSLIASRLAGDEQRSSVPTFEKILTSFPHVRVLVYNGLFDMDCNHVGTSLWLKNLRWQGREAFVSSPRQPWFYDEEGSSSGSRLGGYSVGVDQLLQVVLSNAGHLVPMDQPQASLEMLRRFIKGEFQNKQEEIEEPEREMLREVEMV